MPERYVKMRDKLIRRGVSVKSAKTQAAKIFNATRKRGEKPVTGKHD
jgi:hypothetical protein